MRTLAGLVDDYAKLLGLTQWRAIIPRVVVLYESDLVYADWPLVFVDCNPFPSLFLVSCECVMAYGVVGFLRARG